MSKSGHPTLEELDEPLCLYGLDPEKMIEVELWAKPKNESEPEVTRLIRPCR
jgi:hypothetical protein